MARIHADPDFPPDRLEWSGIAHPVGKTTVLMARGDFTADDQPQRKIPAALVSAAEVAVDCVRDESPTGDRSLDAELSMKLEDLKEGAAPKRSARRVAGRCLCGAVELEIDFPAFWAWHDHSAASRRAHGAAYATYIGCWRKHARVAKGRRSIARFEDEKTASIRSFCSRCGSPLLYERKRSPHMVNIPRALFTDRTGREPRYHVGIDELQDWAYTGKRLVPLNGYPGIVWERPKSRKRPRDLEPLDRHVPSARARPVW